MAEQKESRILEGHLLADHVHMLISIPPKSTEQVSVTMSRGDISKITLLVLLVLPAAAIGLGILVWLKRRR